MAADKREETKSAKQARSHAEQRTGRSAESYGESREPVPRILALWDILSKFSSDDRGLTFKGIQIHGYPPVSSKTFHRDIKQLGDWVVRKGHKYYFIGHPLAQDDLMLFADLARSSRVISAAKADQLVAGLKESLAIEDARLLDEGPIHASMPHPSSDAASASIKTIRAALFSRRQISFLYFNFTLDKGNRRRLRRDGRRYSGTPLCLVYDDGFYYLELYEAIEAAIRTFRVDRMVDTALESDAAESNDAIRGFDAKTLLARSFGMFDGEDKRRVVLEFDEQAANGIVDRFGEDFVYGRLRRTGDGLAEIAVDVVTSMMFYSWIAGFGGHVRIAKPNDVLEEYRDVLRKLADGGTAL